MKHYGCRGMKAVTFATLIFLETQFSLGGFFLMIEIKVLIESQLARLMIITRLFVI
jgi:hypothetical protein